MWTRFKQFWMPPVFADEDATRTAALLHVLLLTLLAATVLGTVVIIPLEPEEFAFNLIFGVGLTLTFLWFLWLVRRQRLRGVSYVLATLLWLSFTALVAMGNGLRDPSITGYFLVITVASLLLRGRGALLYGALSVLSVVGLLVAERAGFISATFTPVATVPHLVVVTVTIILTSLLLRSAMSTLLMAMERLRRDELMMTDINRELESSRDSLAARTSDLERRSTQLQAVAEVGHIAISLREQEALYTQIPRVVADQFELYHVGLYLLDESAAYLILRGHYSRPNSLALQNAVEVGMRGDIGAVAATGAVYRALDEGVAPVDFSMTAFPRTRSRLALPVRAGARLLGVLDLHSLEASVFHREDEVALQVLADQLGVALENAMLLTQTQEALETAQRAYGEVSRRAWTEFINTTANLGFRGHDRGVTRAGAVDKSEVLRAFREGVTVQGEAEDSDHVLAIPIKIRDEVIGVLDTYKPAETQGWTAQELEILQLLTEQLGIALEGARLYQDTQRRAAREQMISEVTGHIRETLDVEAVLKTAVDEIRQALQLERLVVRLGAPDEDAVHSTEKGRQDVEQD